MEGKGLHKISKQVVPTIAHSAISNCKAGSNSSLPTSVHQSITSRGGSMLGIARPFWMKVLQSEQRLAWLKVMVKKKLVVRDLESYLKQISVQLRSEDVRIKEEEREILMSVMELKIKDEKVNLIETRRERDNLRRQIVEEIGHSRKYNTLIKKLRKEMIVKRQELKSKYRNKTNHLETIRKREIEEKKLERKVPDELYDYK